MSEFVCTPSQTVGPFFSLGLACHTDLTPASHPRAVRLHGTVYDGAGHGVPDAVVELWQADAAGRIARSPRPDTTAFTGWGRAATDPAGRYGFTTVPPGPVGGRPPFFALAVFARGLLNRLCTRAYLPGGDVDADLPLCISENGGAAYRFDIHLQGSDETPFLAYRDGGP